MEEGPEPHEGIERMVEHHHHEHGHGEEGKGRTTLVSAITAAVLAVCAAIGSLLSGHAANEAVLNQSRANDQWAYYQAKSTKGHIYEADAELLKALAEVQGTDTAKVQPRLEYFDGKRRKYDKEKEEIQAEASHLDAESTHEFAKHKYYSYGVAAFQVAIVLCSISILVRTRPLYFALYLLGVLAGLAGLAFLLCGAFVPQPAPAGPPKPEARLVVPWSQGQG